MQAPVPKSPLTILLVMRLFPGLMPLYRVPPGDPEGMPTIYKLLQALSAAGHEVHFAGVVHPRFDQVPAAPSELGRPVLGAKLHLIKLPYIERLQALGGKRNPLNLLLGVARNIYLYLRLRNLIRELRPDVLYVGGSYYVIGGLCGKQQGVPVILRFYGVWTLFESLGKWRTALKTPMLTLGFKVPNEQVIITNDGSRGDKVARHYGIPIEKINFWINGTDKDAYRPEMDRTPLLDSFQIPTNAKLIVTIDRLQDWKRVDRIVRSAPEVIAKVPEAHFVIVGDGPERPRLEALSRELAVSGNVHFAGAVAHRTVYDFVNAADIYVSLHALQNLSVGVIEALVCGSPLVSIDDGSFDELVRDGFEQVLLSPEVVDDTVGAAIVDLLSDETRRTELGRAAREFAVTKLETWDQRMEKEVRLIERVAASR